MATSSNSAAFHLKKIDFQRVDGRAIAPQEIVQRGIASCEKTLVGFFIEKRLGFPMVKKHLENRWALKEPLEMLLDRNLFYMRFNSEEMKEINSR